MKIYGSKNIYIYNFIFIISLIFCFFSLHSDASNSSIVMGSKKITESVILGDIGIKLLSANGLPVIHRQELGLSQILWRSLLRGDIDIYPEYTGTLIKELLPEYNLKNLSEIQIKLRQKFGVGTFDPFGFVNNFALGISEELGEKLKISKISDLKKYPNIRFGLSHDFIDRNDGWPLVQRRYQLNHSSVIGMEHELTYRALNEKVIDVIDLYSTDAEISLYKIRILEDDLGIFPNYQGIYIYRLDLERRFPRAIPILMQLGGSISQQEMVHLNRRAKVDRLDEKQVALEFLSQYSMTPRGSGFDNLVKMTDSVPGNFTGWNFIGKLKTAEIWLRTQEHLYLVFISLLSSIFVAIPLGVFAAKVPRLGPSILGIAGIIQTIPSLALLVFMVPIFGIGTVPSVAALFLYSLLPIVRNTYTGISSIPESISESASGIGLNFWQKLAMVEMPMASKSIFSGVKTAAVINVGTATLGSMIGAGGLGQLILVGVRKDDLSMILQGAVPAAVLAILVQALFDWGERRFLTY